MSSEPDLQPGVAVYVGHRDVPPETRGVLLQHGTSSLLSDGARARGS
jgi:hypothetical protein